MKFVCLVLLFFVMIQNSLTTAEINPIMPKQEEKEKPETKRIEPNPDVSLGVMCEQLRAYTTHSPKSGWARRWMDIAATKLEQQEQEATIMHDYYNPQ